MQLRLAFHQTSVCWSPLETRYISKSSTSTRLQGQKDIGNEEKKTKPEVHAMTKVSEEFPVMLPLKCGKCCQSTSAEENIALLKRVADLLHLCIAQLAAGRQPSTWH